MVEQYYSPKYSFSSYCHDLQAEKIAGDELHVVLMAKYLRRNITVFTPFNTWTMYPSLKEDIILTYDGKYGATQDLETATGNQSKNEFLLDLFLNKHPLI